MNYYQQSDSTDDDSLSIEQQLQTSLDQSYKHYQNLESQEMKLDTQGELEILVFQNTIRLQLVKRKKGLQLVSSYELRGMLINSLESVTKYSEQEKKLELQEIMSKICKETIERKHISEQGILNFFDWQKQNKSFIEMLNALREYLSTTMKLQQQKPHHQNNKYQFELNQRPSQIQETMQVETKIDPKKYREIILGKLAKKQ